MTVLLAGCAAATSPVPETPEETKHRVIREIAEKIRDIFPKNHPQSDIRVEGDDVYAVLNTVLWTNKDAKTPQRGYGIVMPKPDSLYMNIRVVGPSSHKPGYLNAPEEWHGNPTTSYIVSYHLKGAPDVYIAISMAYRSKADRKIIESIKQLVASYADKKS